MTDKLANQFIKRKSGAQPMVLLSKTLANLAAGRSSSEALQPRESGIATVIELYFPIQKARKGSHKAAGCEWDCGGRAHPESGRVCRLCKHIVQDGSHLDILIAEAHIKKECTALTDAERRTLWRAFKASDEEAFATAKQNKRTQSAQAATPTKSTNIDEIHRKYEKGLTARYRKERKEKTPVEMSFTPEPVTEEEIYRAAILASKSQTSTSSPPTHERNTRNASRHRAEVPPEAVREVAQPSVASIQPGGSKRRKIQSETAKEVLSASSPKTPSQPSVPHPAVRREPAGGPSTTSISTAARSAPSVSSTPTRAALKPHLPPTPASLPAAKVAANQPSKVGARHRAPSDLSRTLLSAIAAVPASLPSKSKKRKRSEVVGEVQETAPIVRVKREEEDENVSLPVNAQFAQKTTAPTAVKANRTELDKANVQKEHAAGIVSALLAAANKLAPLPPLPSAVPLVKYKKHMKVAFPPELQPFAAFLVRSGFKNLKKMKRKILSPEYLRFLMIRMGQTFRRLGCIEVQCRLEFAIRTVLFPETLAGFAEPSV